MPNKTRSHHIAIADMNHETTHSVSFAYQLIPRWPLEHQGSVRPFAVKPLRDRGEKLTEWPRPCIHSFLQVEILLQSIYKPNNLRQFLMKLSIMWLGFWKRVFVFDDKGNNGPVQKSILRFHSWANRKLSSNYYWLRHISRHSYWLHVQ